MEMVGSYILQVFGEKTLTWIISKFLDRGLDWFKNKKLSERDVFSEIVENVIDRNSGVELKKEHFILLFNDPIVKNELNEFEEAKKEIDNNIIVKSFQKIVFGEKEDKNNSANKIIDDLFEEIRFVIFSNPEYTNRFFFSLVEIFKNNQTDFSKNILSEVGKIQDRLTSGLNEIKSDIKTGKELTQGGIDKILSKLDNLPNSQNNSLNSKIKIANDLMNEGKILSARKIYIEILKDVKQDEKDLLWKLNSNIGKTYLNDYNDIQSSQYFKEAYNIYPNEEKGLIQLALSYLTSNNPIDGIKIIDKVLSLNTTSTEAKIIKSNLLIDSGNVDEAIKLFDNQKLDNFNICYAYGFALGKAKKYEEANDVLLKALNFDRSPMALDLIAINMLEPVLGELQNLRPINLNKSSDYYKKLVKALDYLNESIELWNQQEVKKQLAVAYMNQGVIYSLLKEVEKCMDNYKISERLGLVDATLYRNIGVCFVENGEFKEASKYFIRAIEEGDTYSKEHLLNSLILDRNFTKAKEIILENVNGTLDDLNKDNYYYYVVLSDIYERELKDEESKIILDKLFYEYPNDIKVITRVVDFKKNKGEIDEAINLLNDKINIISSKEVIKFELADLYFQLKNFEKSTEFFSQIHSEYKFGYIERMFLYSLINSGKYSEAVSFINTLEKNIGTDVEELNKMRGNILLFYERFEESKEIFKKLSTNYRKSEYYIKWGLSEFRLGEANEAEKILLSAEKDFKNDYRELIRISSAFNMFGNNEKALELAFEALKGLPDDQDANNNYLGVFLSYEQINPEVKISEDKIKLYQETLENFEKKFPSSKQWQKIQVDSELTEVKQLLADQEESMKRFEEIYQINKLPLSITSKIINRNIYSTWASFLYDSSKKIYAYDFEPLESEKELISISEEVIIEPISFFTLYYLKKLDLIEKIFKKYYFPQKLLDTLFIERNRLDMSTKSGLVTFFTIKGEIYKQEISTLDIEKQRYQLNEMINFVKNKTVGYEIVNNVVFANDKIFDLMDTASKQAIQYSLNKSIPIIIDESKLLTMFNSKYSIPGFSTRTVLSYAKDLNIIDEIEHNKCIIRLILGYYYFISVNATIIIQGLKEEDFKVNFSTQFLLKYLNQKEIDEISVAKVLADLFISLFSEKISPIKQDAWIDTALDSLPRNRFNTTSLLKFIYNRIEIRFRGLIEYDTVVKWIDGRMNTWSISRAVPYFK